MTFETKKIDNLFVQLLNKLFLLEDRYLKNSKISDLSVAELHVIEAIGLQNTRSMSEIAGSLSITLGTLTTAMDRLVKKGYATRWHSEEDRRVVLTCLTEQGQTAFNEHAAFHAEITQLILACLTKEESTVLLGAMEKLNETVDKYL